jgi:hypothetical protein
VLLDRQVLLYRGQFVVHGRAPLPTLLLKHLRRGVEEGGHESYKATAAARAEVPATKRQPLPAAAAAAMAV